MMRLMLPRLSALMAVPVLLAACATPPAPVAARLSTENLTVTLSDGTDCTAPASPEGRFDRCNADLGWQIAPDLPANPLRQVVEAVFTGIGAETALAPMARITLTDAAGRSKEFISPEPLDLSNFGD
ncbi:hypothetical protein GEU84_017345 [Fertoebacter nigrum]|uniref:Lipoprotein n=1 Tax=Fertoeibacter niger TaxID=2656921 RepID=A0A8X8KS84_9RHOB|nr:hypothetical protein [Fertoeibacter niger]NUB46162.1 hypothetical protein [Fertoeibacter niger]